MTTRKSSLSPQKNLLAGWKGLLLNRGMGLPSVCAKIVSYFFIFLPKMQEKKDQKEMSARYTAAGPYLWNARYINILRLFPRKRLKQGQAGNTHRKGVTFGWRTLLRATKFAPPLEYLFYKGREFFYRSRLPECLIYQRLHLCVWWEFLLCRQLAKKLLIIYL